MLTRSCGDTMGDSSIFACLLACYRTSFRHDVTPSGVAPAPGREGSAPRAAPAHGPRVRVSIAFHAFFGSWILNT
jgi:hypothetical protein